MTMRMGLLLALLGLPGLAAAEPYLAVREGLKCQLCHVNPTGGGMRTPFGTAYAQNVLSQDKVQTVRGEILMESLDDFLSLGGDFRASATYTEVPNQDSSNAFATDEFRLYAVANVVPNRLIVYVDERLAPGGAGNQEAYARLSTEDGRWFLKAGQMYLPYGLRLEDDSAFVRERAGINMETPDQGVELGAELDAWTAQLAISNGSAGAAESDQGKQGSLRVEYVQPAWRAGGSVNFNDAKAGTRSMQNVFAGLKTGPLSWLGEVDYVHDDSFAGGARTLWVGLLETNWGWARGHNAKLSGEYFEPDDNVAEDHQARYSLVWEYTPMQFLQARVGARVYDGIPQNDLQNRRVLFVQLHAFF